MGCLSKCAAAAREQDEYGESTMSSPTCHEQGNNLGGAIQYDYGETVRQQRFQSARFMNKPPGGLPTPVEALGYSANFRDSTACFTQL